MKILIFGLSGSGKSTLAEPFAELINGVWLNADEIRGDYDDWDFSEQGRINQAGRMSYIADGVVHAGRIAILDFVCPTNLTRKIVDADYTIWMDTVKESKYKDTDKIFEQPDLADVDYHVSEWFDDTHKQLVEIVKTYMSRNQIK